MLFHSVTVLIDQLSASSFISSPLYERFVSALASVIPAEERDVFVFNVQEEDTSAFSHNGQEEPPTGPRVHVSFSVRRGGHHVSGQDLYYGQQYLRERVYLQRTLLARLSTLEVCWWCRRHRSLPLEILKQKGPDFRRPVRRVFLLIDVGIQLTV